MSHGPVTRIMVASIGLYCAAMQGHTRGFCVAHNPPKIYMHDTL